VKVADLLRVAELIETAEMNKQEPDLSGETPDLLQLFAGARRRGRIPTATQEGKPSLPELIESVRDGG
jgi:hypothetical protein